MNLQVRRIKEYDILKRNRFIDDRQVDEIADIDIVENDEGLDDVDPEVNFKYLNINTNHHIVNGDSR